MKTAVIYARYSSDSQTEQSIDGQLRVCEEYAKKNNILIVQTYIDRAMTGTNDKRPDFQQMLKDSYKKQWDYVLVYKLDRFSRNKYESVVHKKTLKENGVKLISAMENIPDSPEGIILESLLEGMNQYYSAELAQKIKRGMHECRIKGNYQGGGVPYGYKVVNKKLIIDEDKSEIVKYIASQPNQTLSSGHNVQKNDEGIILYELDYGAIYKYSYVFDGILYSDVTGYVGNENMLTSMMGMMGGSGVSMSGSKSYSLTLRQAGGNKLANSIAIYPTNFELKDGVTEHLDAWNLDGDITIGDKVLTKADIRCYRSG